MKDVITTLIIGSLCSIVAYCSFGLPSEEERKRRSIGIVDQKLFPGYHHTTDHPIYSSYTDCNYHKPSRASGYYICTHQNGISYKEYNCVTAKNYRGFICW